MADGDEETVAQYRGVIRIEWPAACNPGPYGSMVGSLLSVFDAMSGKQILTCVKAVIHADMDALVTADLTLFTDADGEPILDGEPVQDEDRTEIRTGVFPFLVGEMRVRQ